MKLCKRLLTLALAVMLVCSLGMTAFADDNGTNSKVTIKIKDALPDAKYNAYRILNATVDLKDRKCHDQDDQHASTCYNISYTFNSDYLECITNVLTEMGLSATEPVQIIGAMNATQIRTFADMMFKHIQEEEGKTPDVLEAGEYDPTTKSTNVELPKAGYWLIEEVVTLSDKEGASTRSLVLLDTVGNRTIELATKRETLTMKKEVDDNGVGYTVAADHQIGDTVSFMILANLPQANSYDTYTYLLHDQMDAGLTMSYDDADTVIYINDLHDSSKVLEKTYYEYKQKDNSAEFATCGCTFHLHVKVKKAFTEGKLTSTDRLYITYKATLNKDAKVFKRADKENTNNANTNTAWLEYSGNPYVSDTQPADTLVTQKSTCYVWTFPMNLTKVDNGENHVRLNDARFILVRNNPNLKVTFEDDQLTINNEPIADYMSKNPGVVLTFNATETTEAGKDNVYKINPQSSHYSIVVGSANILGLDDHVDYYLYEYKNPDGYNLLKEPVKLKFYAEYNATNPGVFASGYPYLTVVGGESTEELAFMVENSAGVELPSTGGIGTTIFYVLGGIMVVGAAVLLITKKRMGAEV